MHVPMEASGERDQNIDFCTAYHMIVVIKRSLARGIVVID